MPFEYLLDGLFATGTAAVNFIHGRNLQVRIWASEPIANGNK